MPDFTFSQAIVIGGVAATITAIGGFVIARFRNRHEIRLKELDSQQKKTDFQYSVDLDTQKRKAQAAETIVKQWTLILRRIELQETFYKQVVARIENPKSLYILAKRYEENMTEITKRIEAEDKDISDLLALYFGTDSPVGKEVREVRSELGNDLVILQQQLNDIVVNLTALANKLPVTRHPITYMALNNAYSATEQTMLYQVRVILAILEADAWALRQGCAIIRKEMNYPQIS